MLLQRFYDEKLAQASYLFGCQATGDALVVDPNRDVEQFVAAAEREGLVIRHVTETHIHADFVSGARELAARTGATLYLSDEGGQGWRYGYAEDAGAVLLHDGTSFRVGHIRIDALHTPGHTPEHLVFLVTDTVGADGPMGLISGDFVFVGDVGRPDLLERSAHLANTMESGARQLFQSLQLFRELPDYLQLWPGHGAGSACGKALGAVPQSTVGYEKLFNWALQIDDEDEFVGRVLEGQPEPPRYFAEMKRINREGPRVLGGFPRPPRMPETRLPQALEAGDLVVDTRVAAEFARRHIPGTVNIPLNRAFTTWAGSLIPYDRDFYLLVDERGGASRIDEAVRDLAMIGLDRIAGYFAADAVETWASDGRATGGVDELTPAEVHARRGKNEIVVVDVRGAAEWDQGHLPGALHIPLAELPERAGEVPRDRPVVVHCQGGSRSAIAASLLKARGWDRVANLKGNVSELLALEPETAVRP